MERVWDCGFPHWTSTEPQLGSMESLGCQWLESMVILGLVVAMMMIGGRRSHNGTVNQRSTSKVRLQNGTVIILRKPGATIVAHWNSGWVPLMFPLRNTACSCGERWLVMPNFSFRTSVTKTCCIGMLGRGYLKFWLRLTSISASSRIRMILTLPFRNCSASAIRHCYSLQTLPGLLIWSTTPMATLCLIGRRAWSS